MEGELFMEKLSQRDKKILKEDLADLKLLLKSVKAVGNEGRAANIEKEIKEIERKLKGE